MPEQSISEDGSFRLSRECSSSFDSNDSSHSSTYYGSDDQENFELPSDSDEDDASGDEVDDDDVELALQILAQMEEQEEKRRVGSEEKKQGAEVNEGTTGEINTPTVQQIGIDTQDNDSDEDPCSVTSPISLIITSIEKAAEEARRMEIQVTKTGAEDDLTVDLVGESDGCSDAKEVDDSAKLSIEADDLSKELQQKEYPKREEPTAQQVDLFEDDMRSVRDSMAGEKSEKLQNDEECQTETNNDSSKKSAAPVGKDINTDSSCTEEKGEWLNEPGQQEGLRTTGGSEERKDHVAIADETVTRQRPDTEEIESDKFSDFEEAVEAEAVPQTGTEEAERELYHDAVAEEDEQNETQHEDMSDETHKKNCQDTSSKKDEEQSSECITTTKGNIDVRLVEEGDDEDYANVAKEAGEGEASGEATEKVATRVDLTEAEPSDAQKNSEKVSHVESKTVQSESKPSIGDKGAGESSEKNTHKSDCIDETKEASSLEITSVTPTEIPGKISSATLNNKEQAINSSAGETIEDEPRHEVEGEKSDNDLGASDMVAANADTTEEDYKDKEAAEKPTTEVSKGEDVVNEVEMEAIESSTHASEAVQETLEHVCESTLDNNVAQDKCLDKRNETEVPLVEPVCQDSKHCNEVEATKQATSGVPKSHVVCTDSSEATERTSNVHEIDVYENIEAQDADVEDNIEARDHGPNETKNVQQVGQALIDSTKGSKHQPKLWWNNDKEQDASDDAVDEAVKASPLLKNDAVQSDMHKEKRLDSENLLACEDTRNEKDVRDSVQVENSTREAPAHTKSPDSPLKEILVNTDERGDSSEEMLNEETGKVLSPTVIQKVKFRDPFVCPPPPPAPRSSREIVKTHSKPSTPQDIKWKKPSAQLEELIGAANGPSLSRRSHACGTLKVLSTSKKNRRILARTTGILDALAFVNKETVDAGSKAAIEARTRAVTTIVHLSIPVENRVIMMRNANVLDSLVIVIREDRGEPRALACSALAYLAKTEENRFALINVHFLLNALAETVGQIGERKNRSKDMNDDPSTVSREPTEVAVDKYAVKTKVDKAKRKKKEVARAAENEAFIARSNACAVLIHLAKDCASLEFLARHELLMNTLAEVAIEFDVAIHTRCIEVICHLTRFPSNARLLATKKKVLDTLITCTKSVVKEDRVWAARGLQNITSDNESKVDLAKAPLLNALCMSAMSTEREEQLASLSALLNLTGDPGTITNLTNTKFVVSTLINLAHNTTSSSDVRLIACDCLAAIGLWLQTLAGSGPLPEGIDEQVLPTHTATGWQRWE